MTMKRNMSGDFITSPGSPVYPVSASSVAKERLPAIPTPPPGPPVIPENPMDKMNENPGAFLNMIRGTFPPQPFQFNTGHQLNAAGKIPMLDYFKNKLGLQGPQTRPNKGGGA